jgi:hypothetical protein
MRLDQLAYTNNTTGRNLRFLGGLVHSKWEAGDVAGAARAARTGASLTTCNIWASVANWLESLAK